MNERPPSGEIPAVHLATNAEVAKWGWAHLLAAAVGAVGGTGAVIVFLVSYAGTVEAKSVSAAQAIAMVQAQRMDVLKGDQEVLKARVEAVDAGVARKLDALEKKVDEATRRSEQRADQQEAILREVLKEVRRK